jgi:hypothetical protein
MDARDGPLRVGQDELVVLAAADVAASLVKWPERGEVAAPLYEVTLMLITASSLPDSALYPAAFGRLAQRRT